MVTWLLSMNVFEAFCQLWQT